MSEGIERRLAAIISADVAGYEIQMLAITFRDTLCQFKESALSVRTDAPVGRYALIAVIDVFALKSVIEQAPRGVFVQRGEEVVVRLIEIEMVVFVEQDWLGRVTRDLAGLPDHLADSFGLIDAVAMQQQKVAFRDHIGVRYPAAAVAGSGQQASVV